MYRAALWQARKAVDWCELEDLGEDQMKEERKMYLESLVRYIKQQEYSWQHEAHSQQPQNLEALCFSLSPAHGRRD